MAFMTVNRVHIRSVWILPVFAWVIWRIYRQARRAPGNLGVRIFRTRGLAVWTVTAWTSEDAMRAFRDSGPHGRARPKKPLWFDEAAITEWHQSDPTLPTNEQAASRLRTAGRLSAVRNPSPAQAAGEIVVD
jgi:heme-degrading monooxygenase HmoA